MSISDEHQLAAGATTILPYLGDEVPIIRGPEGFWYVPLGILCRLLELDPHVELRRARRILLWHAALACLLPLRCGQRTVYAWCFGYPLGIGDWFWQIHPRVRDPERRQQLERFIEDNSQLSALATNVVQARFNDGRQRMYRLAHHLSELQERIEAVLSRLDAAQDRSLGDREQTEQLALRLRALADQAQTFVRAWLVDKADLPVVDGVRVDEHGEVLDASVSITLFGTISAQERELLASYERAIGDAIAALALLEPGQDTDR